MISALVGTGGLGMSEEDFEEFKKDLIARIQGIKRPIPSEGDEDDDDDAAG
jgi:hypothetical protein